MKKILLTIVISAASLVTYAQSTIYKPFKVDIAFGYAIPAGSGSKGGVIFAVEPKYALSNNFTVGLRMEAAATARATTDDQGNVTVGDVKASGSYLLTGDYYFGTNGIRPFVGAGLGIFTLASVDTNNSSDAVSSTSSKFGFMPRIGMETGHFRIGLEYNVAGKSNTVDYNYLGIKIGFFLGGGRIN